MFGARTHNLPPHRHHPAADPLSALAFGALCTVLIGVLLDILSAPLINVIFCNKNGLTHT